MCNNTILSTILSYCFACCLLLLGSCTQETGIEGEKELTASESFVFVETGKEAVIKISGNGAYSAEVEQPEVLSARIEGEQLRITGLKSGESTVSVLDKLGLYTTVKVVVVDPGNRKTDSLVLIELYAKNTPDNWYTPWDIGRPIDEWHGVKLNKEGRVSELDLSYAGLIGELPASIGKLVYLQKLDLSSNAFKNELPQEIASLLRLKELRLFAMKGMRVSPMTIEKLSRLKELEKLTLVDVALTEPLKPILDKFTTLSYLELGINELNRFPLEVCSLSQLESLTLWNGNFGILPPEIAQLKNLKYLSLEGNGITGDIPPEIGEMKELQFLNMSNNHLVGNVPESFTGLAKLQVLFLWNNELSGLPTDMTKMKSLTALSVKRNKIRTPLPKLNGLDRLRLINLEYNNIVGELDPSWTTLASLKELYLGHNRISGQIPEEFGNFPKLRQLDLNRNQLTGTVPLSFASFQPTFGEDFYRIDLRGNRLSGKLDPIIRAHPMYVNEKWIFSPQQTGYGFDDISKIIKE